MQPIILKYGPVRPGYTVRACMWASSSRGRAQQCRACHFAPLPLTAAATAFAAGHSFPASGAPCSEPTRAQAALASANAQLQPPMLQHHSACPVAHMGHQYNTACCRLLDGTAAIPVLRCTRRFVVLNGGLTGLPLCAQSRVSPAWETISGARHIWLMLTNPLHTVTVYEVPITRKSCTNTCL